MEADKDGDVEGLFGRVAVIVMDDVRVNDAAVVPDRVTVCDDDTPGLLDGVVLTDTLVEIAGDFVCVIDLLTVAETDTLRLGDCDPPGDGVVDALRLGVRDGRGVTDTETVEADEKDERGESVNVTEIDDVLSADALRDAVTLGDRDELEDRLGDAVDDTDFVTLGVTDVQREDVGDAVKLRDERGDGDGLELCEGDVVACTDFDELRLWEGEGVVDCDRVPLDDTDGVRVSVNRVLADLRTVNVLEIVVVAVNEVLATGEVDTLALTDDDDVVEDDLVVVEDTVALREISGDGV